MHREGKWLGSNFADFLQRIPKSHLQKQLYMFSSRYNIEEAISNVQKLSHFFFIDDFNGGISKINKDIGVELKPIHIRKAKFKVEIPGMHMERLSELLRDEYDFLDRLRK